MGVIHKLEPEVIDFILAKKTADSGLSCRQISALISDKFQITLSKSSVNYLVKNAGMSSVIGRRRKSPRQKKILPANILAPMALPSLIQTKPALPLKPESGYTGAILLRAADFLFGGSINAAQAIQNRLNRTKENLSAFTEEAIYMPLKKIPENSVISYLNELKQIKGLGQETLKVFRDTLQQVRCIRLSVSENSNLYLDGQLHTIWSTPHIPYSFSAPMHNIKERLGRLTKGAAPFVFFMAPGYDSPTKEFFDFILELNSPEKRILRFTLWGNKLEELQNVDAEKNSKLSFIFGLWPWQFIEYRKTGKIGEFRQLNYAAIKDSLYIADIEVELTQPKTKQTIVLKGAALKRNPAGKTELIILSNMPDGKPAQEIVKTYLSCWPNLEEAFRDYSRKVELFTYAANAQESFPPEEIFLKENAAEDIKNIFEDYLKALDLFIRMRILPYDHRNNDFPTDVKRFYGLSARLEQKEDFLLATFIPPAGYPFLKDLEYACRRINEKQIIWENNKQLYCIVGVR